MKKIHLLFTTVVLTLILCGCGNITKKYDKNTLIVKGNDSLMELSIENFAKTNVSGEDITNYIEEQIDLFNDENGKKIKEKSIDVEDLKRVKLVLTYKDIESFNQFNGQKYVLDDYSNIKESQMKGSFQSVDGKKVKLDDFEINKKTKVLMLSESMDVVIEGDILYYNKEVSLKDEVATTTGDDVAIIIYK